MAKYHLSFEATLSKLSWTRAYYNFKLQKRWEIRAEKITQHNYEYIENPPPINGQ